MDIGHLRVKYTTKGLDVKDLDKNPLKQFEIWFNDAINEQLLEPNAFSLATVGNDMMPSIRTVLLKIFDEKGFVFFTNYKSTKAKQIEENPKAAALFAWLELERQVKIEGSIEKIPIQNSFRAFIYSFDYEIHKQYDGKNFILFDAKLDSGSAKGKVVKAVMESYWEDEIVAYTVAGKALNKESYQNELNEGIEEIKRGDFITQEDLEKESENW